MKELDTMIAEARNRMKQGAEVLDSTEKPVILNALTPESIIQAHLLPLQKAEVERGKLELQELKQRNEQMLKSLVEGSDHAKILLKRIAQSLDDLKRYNKATSSMPSKPEIMTVIDSVMGDNANH